MSLLRALPTLPYTDPSPLTCHEPDTRRAPATCPTCGHSGSHPAKHDSGLRPAQRAPSVAELLRWAPVVDDTATVGDVHNLLLCTPNKFVVVVDAERRPLGALTRAEVLACLGEEQRSALAALRAVDVSTPGGAYLYLGSLRDTAARFCVEGERDFVIVVDDDGRFAGVVTVYDLLSERLRA